MSRERLRPTRRGLMVITLLAALCLPAAGCGGGAEEKAARDQRNQQAVTDIRTQIEALPTVVKAVPNYRGAENLADTDHFNIDIEVEGGAPFEPVLDGAERIVWLSRLAPLGGVILGVRDSADPARLMARNVSMTPDVAPSFSARYGPRPSP